MNHQPFITSLKQFLGNVDVVGKSDSIQVYDGVDIIYSLVSESDVDFLLIPKI